MCRSELWPRSPSVCQLRAVGPQEQFRLFADSSAAERLAELLGLPLLGVLPLDPLLAARCESGQQLGSLDPQSPTEQALQRIVEKVVRFCEQR